MTPIVRGNNEIDVFDNSIQFMGRNITASFLRYEQSFSLRKPCALNNSDVQKLE
jgi:hypothetical protein